LADDIRIKQLGRELRRAVKSGDQAAIKEKQLDQLRFELAAYIERVEKYPTDLRLRFELAVRYFRGGRFDEAIPLFQSARNDPRNRASAGMYLGRCFFRKGYHSQAISTLREAIQHYEHSDDELAKNMQYWLGRAQEEAKQVEEARKTYGALLQLDYNFRDVRDRLDGLPAEA
jgi:tetratricopeptide (TPR) repeat protein